MKRVLITGGFGYLGGRIAVELSLKSAWKLRLSSRRARSAPAWLSQAEVATFDVLDRESLGSAMERIQAVVHLAAMNEDQCARDPDRALLVNTRGTFNVLKAAIQAGVERFIYFSTAHVYGAPLVGHITEKTLTRPVHPYAITHRAAEDFVLSAHDSKDVTGIVVRLSNGFGAPTHPEVDRWSLLVNDLCHQAIHTEKLVLRSSGLQIRDFVTLTDVGRAVRHLLNLPRQECADGLFNLGGDNPMTILQMTEKIAQRCRQLLGFLPEIQTAVATSQVGTELLDYDCRKLKATGFSLSGSVSEEIDNTLSVCKQSWQAEAR